MNCLKIVFFLGWELNICYGSYKKIYLSIYLLSVNKFFGPRVVINLATIDNNFTTGMNCLKICFLWGGRTEYMLWFLKENLFIYLFIKRQ